MIYGLKKKAFLAAFRETGNVRAACDAAEVGRSTHYGWLGADPAYQQAFDLASYVRRRPQTKARWAERRPGHKTQTPGGKAHPIPRK